MVRRRDLIGKAALGIGAGSLITSNATAKQDGQSDDNIFVPETRELTQYEIQYYLREAKSREPVQRALNNVRQKLNGKVTYDILTGYVSYSDGDYPTTITIDIRFSDGGKFDNISISMTAESTFVSYTAANETYYTSSDVSEQVVPDKWNGNNVGTNDINCARLPIEEICSWTSITSALGALASYKLSKKMKLKVLSKFGLKMLGHVGAVLTGVGVTCDVIDELAEEDVTDCSYPEYFEVCVVPTPPPPYGFGYPTLEFKHPDRCY